MGHSHSKDTAIPERVLKGTHMVVFGGAGLVALGWYLGRDGDGGDARLPIKMARWGAYSILFGSQIWNSFIGGAVLFKTAPMHTFGEVQTYMLPTYFNLQMLMAASSISMHLYLHPTTFWTQCERMVMKAMAVTFVSGFVNMTVMLDRNLKVMNRMFAIEKEAGVGQQVGKPSSEKLEQLMKDPEYATAKKSFGKQHGISMLINMVGIGGSILHLVYLTQHGP